MKFAHLADCHIGGWPDPKLKELSIKAFEKAIDICIKEKTAFILISGDLFNTAIPSIDLIRETAKILNRAREKDITIYIIPGSHDFSPSGKTMLDVFEKAGLCINAFKLENDKLKLIEDKTGVKITGIYGRRGGLEVKDYERIDMSEVEKESGFKIFMLHSAVGIDKETMENEFAEREKRIAELLPKNFNYYAAGHLHKVIKKEFGNGLLVYPGPLFPNNFKELEEIKNGGFFLLNFKDNKLYPEYIPIKIKDVVSFKIDANSKTPRDVEEELLKMFEEADLKDKIVTIRIEGELISGKPSDINFRDIFSKFKDAYFIMKNTAKLTTKELSKIKKKEYSTAKDIEDSLIKDYIKKAEGFESYKKIELIRALMQGFNMEKAEGELKKDFERRIYETIEKIVPEILKNDTEEH